MEVLPIANVVNVTVALMTGLYQFWFFNMRPERRDAFWAGLISLSAALYAGAMIFYYRAESVESVLFANRFLYFSVLGISYSVFAFAQALTKKRLYYWHLFAPLSILIWTVLIFATNWIVTDQVAEIPLLFSPRPAIQFLATPWTHLFLVWHISILAFGVFWIISRSRKNTRKRNYIFGAAIGFWALAGIWDTLVLLRIIESTPTFFTEYGIVAIALALVAQTIREHVGLIGIHEKALLVANQSFLELIDKSSDLITIHQNGAFVHVNPAGEKFLGYSSEELLGASFSKVLHPDDQALARERALEMHRTGQGLPPIRDRMIHKNGEVLVVETLPVPMRYNGRPSLVVMGRDINDRVKLEVKMMQLDRMVALGTLAAGVAHEINNPLTYVVGNVSLVKLQINNLVKLHELPQNRSEFCPIAETVQNKLLDMNQLLGDVEEGSLRIRDIVKDLSDLARTKDNPHERIDLREVVESALKIATNEIKHRAQLLTDFQSVPFMMGDRSKVSQVILNLLMNAAQSISAGHVDENSIKIRIFKKDSNICLEIQDSGMGISAEDLEHIFDPFFTTKEVGKGTGLGLSISRQIIADHGGEIEAESILGESTTFRVSFPESQELPLSAVQKDERESQPEVYSKDSVKRLRILVIDDEPMVLSTLKDTLSEYHDVVTAPDAQSAVLLLDKDQNLDVIFCDLMMPQVSGMELYDIIKSSWPELARRTAFLTGGAFTKEARVFLEGVSQPVISKPPTLEQLLETVADLSAQGTRQP